MIKEENELKITEEVKFIASHLRSYPFWTDGYTDSSSYRWDGVVKNSSDAEISNLYLACNNLKNSMNSENSEQIMRQLSLDSENKSNYIHSLGRMIEVLRF